MEQFTYIRNKMFRKILTKMVSPDYNPSSAPTSEKFKYNFLFKREVIGDALAAKFIQNSKDEGMRAFLDKCDEAVGRPCRLFVNACVSAVLYPCVSVTSINGFLGRGQMYIFSQEQIKKHLDAGQADEGVQFCSLLDIGAGDGNVTVGASFIDLIYAPCFLWVN